MARIGVALRDLLPPAGPRAAMPVRDIVELAVLAERSGFESVWIPEGRGRESLTQLGAIAGATARIHLGTGIMPVFSRPPALAAMAVATLDDLSGGRAILGIGAGHPAVTRSGYGRPFRRPVTAVREFVDIVRSALAGERARYAGRVFQVEDFALEAIPQRPIPVYVAALRERMLRLAGEIGDGVILNWTSPEHAERSAEVVRDAARAAGRSQKPLDVVCYVRACVTENVEAARAVLRRIIATYAALPSYGRMFEESGFAEEVSAIGRRWESSIEAAAQSVSDRMLESLGAVGSAEECRRKVEQFREAGVDLPVIYPFPAIAGSESYRRTIEALAPKG